MFIGHEPKEIDLEFLEIDLSFIDEIDLSFIDEIDIEFIDIT